VLRLYDFHESGNGYKVYGIADIALFAYTHVAHEGGFDLDRTPAVAAWVERVRAQARHIPITRV
jgi:glutathione S-transferase